MMMSFAFDAFGSGSGGSLAIDTWQQARFSLYLCTVLALNAHTHFLFLFYARAYLYLYGSSFPSPPPPPPKVRVKHEPARILTHEQSD